jgi:hypothetical protein
VHGSLKEGGSIGQSEVHNMGNVGAKLGFDGSFVLILFIDADVIVAHAYIKL